MVEGYPDSLEGWGAPAIFKEAGRLLGKYFRLLHPFILAFVFPLAVLQLLELLGLAWIVSHHPHHHHHHHHHHPPHPHPPFPSPFPPHPPHHHPHHPFGGSFHHTYSAVSHEGGYGSYGSAEDAFAPSPAPPPHPPFVALLVGAAVAVLTWVLISLAVAAVAKVVAYVYSSQREEDPGVVRSIFRSLPEALYRLFITTLWLILVTGLAVFVVSLPFKLVHLFLSHSHIRAHRILGLFNTLFVSLTLLVLAFVFLLALEVAVLEPQNYGRAALTKSWRLVRSKLPATLLFFLAALVVVGGLDKLAHLLVFLGAIGKLPFWTVYVSAPVFALLYLAVTVYLLVAAAVLYFSSKAKWESQDQGYLPVNSSDVGDNPYTPLVVPSEN